MVAFLLPINLWETIHLSLGFLKWGLEKNAEENVLSEMVISCSFGCEVHVISLCSLTNNYQYHLLYIPVGLLEMSDLC